MDYFKLIIETLNPENTAVYNRRLAQKIGVTEAIIYQALISKFKYYRTKEQLKEGYFFSTVTDLAESTGFSEYQQRTAIKRLIDLGLIKQKIMSVPARRYFKINEDVDLLLAYLDSSEETAEPVPEKLQNQFLRNCRTSSEETAELVPEKLQTNLNHNLNHKLINQSSINKDDEDKINDLIEKVKNRYKLSLTKEQVVELMTVSSDLNTIQKAIDYVVSYAKSKQFKINKFTAYVKKTLQNMNANIDDVEFDAVRAAEEEKQRKHESNVRLKEQVRSSYELPKPSLNGICAQIHREYKSGK